MRFMLLALALLAALPPADAQEDAVVITAVRDPVAKSYRRMVSGIERFERRRALAPRATLRFKLLPRNRQTDMRNVALAIEAESFSLPLELAPDNSFALPRHAAAMAEDASVMPNRRAGTLTWRAEVRSPGVPPGKRRLGDLRLECEVGMQAGLISNRRPSLFGFLDPLVREGPEYCHRLAPRYLFFAERPLWSVTLVAGARREVLPVDRLYGGATRDPDWKEDLPYCDCEVLIDRAYFLPLGDESWPNDTLIEFEYMEDAP